MTQHITQGSTIIGFAQGTQVVFCGNNADKVAAITGDKVEQPGNGNRHLTIVKNYQDTVYPKLVAAGYKLAIFPFGK